MLLRILILGFFQILISSHSYAQNYEWQKTYICAGKGTTLEAATNACKGLNPEPVVARFVSPGCPSPIEPNTNLYIECKRLKWIAVVPDDAPPMTCPDKAGNPITISRGAKFQEEIDFSIRNLGGVGFARAYNNSNKRVGGFWYNPYQKNLRPITMKAIDMPSKRSSAYTSNLDACYKGWSEIRPTITENWTQNTYAFFSNNTCKIMRGNSLVRKILLVADDSEADVTITPMALQLIREDGSILNFSESTANQYTGLNGELGNISLVKDAAPIAWRFKTNNGDIEDYNSDGKLLSITASNGMKQEFFYDATSGLLSRVKDLTNRELLFAYTGNQLSSVTVDGNKTTGYTYNSLGLITQVTRPDNTTRIYHYEDTQFPTALTGITDERGARYATWAYDAQGRAISSEHAGGAEKTLLAFNADGSTTVTNALNKQTIYRFDDIAGARRVTKVEGQPTTNCLGANQDYTYTSEGWIASKTDWKRIKTTFTYNTLGQEISRTEAFGTPEARTITTEWHPTLFVKIKITEPGKETIYSYDVKGSLLNKKLKSLTQTNQ